MLAVTARASHLESLITFILPTVSLIVLFLAARRVAFKAAATFAASLAALAYSAAIFSFDPPSEHVLKASMDSGDCPIDS